MTPIDNQDAVVSISDEADRREAWVTPSIESYGPVSATASVTSTNPGDIINSNS